MRKNVAGQKVGVQMVDATTHGAFTGTVTVYVTGDAGSQAIGSVASGVCTHKGNGYYTYSPAIGETDYDLVAFTFAGTGAIPVTLQFYTRLDCQVVAADTAGKAAIGNAVWGYEYPVAPELPDPDSWGEALQDFLVVGVTVLPAVGIVADRSPGVTLLPVVGETISQSITIYETDGTTPVDLSGKTLKIIFEAMSGTDVSVVENANITVSGADDNVVTFVYPSAVTASERVLKFALRDAAAPLTMYLQGVCSVTRAPQVDPP